MSRRHARIPDRSESEIAMICEKCRELGKEVEQWFCETCDDWFCPDEDPTHNHSRPVITLTPIGSPEPN